MNYEDLFKILYNLKLHPELVTFIDNKEIEARYNDNKYYRILFKEDGTISFHLSGIYLDVTCTYEEYNEAQVYLNTIRERYKEICVNEVLQSLDL